MPTRKISPGYIADHIRRVLKDGGSAPHAEGVQHFFKEKIQSRGWYTAELRRVATRLRRTIIKERGVAFLIEVADDLFRGPVLEERTFAVLLLQTLTAKFGDAEFRRFDSWISRIRSWADHDGLVHYLIAPMVAAKPARVKHVFAWAKSPDRWRRRAACVALIQGTRQRAFFNDIQRLANHLLADEDDMVQKGLGWLLRETAKASPDQAVPYLMRIREVAPRLVLRTACETLRPGVREKILARAIGARAGR
jgi:3-methyladenine DNA glycosylase AlkD